MDPDLTKELEDQIRMLSDMVSQQTAAMSGLSKSISDYNTSVNNLATGTNKLNSAQTNNTNAINSNNAGMTALQKAASESAEIINKSHTNTAKAIDSLGAGLTSFTKALLSSDEGFSKYNAAIGNVGNAAWSLGKNFGYLGMAAGGLIKVFGTVLEYQTKQADELLTATDSLAKLGAGGAFTADQVRKMGAGAGLTSLELDKLIKPMQSVKGGFVALGGSQSEGMKKFGEMAAVSEDVRREFKRLGMGDQERNQSLADFVSLMNASGQAMTGDLKTQGGLQKAALEYTRNMYELSGITGDDVETAKKKHQAALDTYEVALFHNKMAQDIATAEEKVKNAKTAGAKAAAEAELKKLQKKDKDMDEFTRQMEMARMSPEEIAAAQNMIISGAVTETSKSLAIRQMPVMQLWQKQQEGSLKDGEVASEQNKSVTNFVNRVGPGVMAISEDVRTLSGITKENIAFAGQYYGKSIPDLVKGIKDDIEKNKIGQGAAGLDPAQQTRNDLTEAFRKRKLQLDELAANLNPLLGNTGVLTAMAVAAGLATAALTAMAVKSGISAVKGLFGGKGGKAKIAEEAAKDAEKGLASEGATAAERRAASKAAAREAALAEAAAKRSGSFVAEETAAGGKGLKGLLPNVFKGGAKAMFKPGNLLKLGKTLGKGLAGVAGGIALDYGAEYAKSHGHEKAGAGLDVASAALTGASIGATIGTIVPGLGNVVGGVVGGAIGGMYGLWTNRKTLLPSVFGDSEQKPADDANAPAPAPPTAIEVLKNMLEQVALLQKYNFDVGIISNNAQALSSFATALSSVFAINTSGNAAEKSKEIADSVTAFSKSQPPFDKFVDFSKLPINKEQSINNSEAYVAFAHAMSEYKGPGGSGLSKITNTIAMGIAEHFKVKLPIPEFVAFSKADIDPKKAKVNAKAFVDFANAMAEYKGGPGLGDVISAFVGGKMSKLLGEDGPVAAFKKFAKDDYGPNASKNAEAFYKYAQSINLISAAQSSSAGGGGSGGGGSGGGGNTPAQNGFQAGKQAAGFIGGTIAGGASLVANAWDWAKAGITGKPTDVLNFTGQSGRYENFQALDPSMQKAVIFAATDYKKATGRKMTVNSARRAIADQERLWAETVRLGHPGKGPNGMLVGKPPRLGGNPPHLRGNAIDLQEGKSDGRTAIPILAKYNLRQTYGGKDPVHFDLKASDGGMFSGPDTGYPITMHGTEMVAPLNPNSMLMKLARLPANTTVSKNQEKESYRLNGKSVTKEQYNTFMSSHPNLGKIHPIVNTSSIIEKLSKPKALVSTPGNVIPPAPGVIERNTNKRKANDQAELNLTLYSMVSNKIDRMVDILENSHDTHHKILSHAKV